MSKSEDMRTLARKGLAVADIARQVGVRYQHAYNVLSAAGMVTTARSNIMPVQGRATPVQPAQPRTKPSLSVQMLTSGGFERAGEWIVSGETIAPDAPLPKARGVYAFAKGGLALYVGLATMGLAKRLYFYGRPGATQRTSQRINGLIRVELNGSARIEIYVAMPPDQTWNGLPLCGDAGLELGLIEGFALPWNIRSAS